MKTLIRYLLPIFLTVSTFAQSTPTVQVDTWAALKAMAIPAVPGKLTALVKGRMSTNDGGGGVFTFTAGAGATDDGGTIATPNVGTGAWFRQYSGAVNIKWFGLVGDNSTDNSSTWNSMMAALYALSPSGATIDIPPGTYLGLSLTGMSNLRIRGTPGKSILKQLNSGSPFATLLSFAGSTTNTTGNITNVVIEGVTFRGLSVENGFSQFQHLLHFSGVSDFLIQNCQFLAPQGDAVCMECVGTGSVERHNQNIAFQNCLFDGVNYSGRNGISFVDIDHGIVFGCTFQRLSSTGMPGAIDVEPDNQHFAISRDVTITGCKFNDMGAGADAMILINLLAKGTQDIPPSGFFINNNDFGTNVKSQFSQDVLVRWEGTPVASTPSLGLVITDNNFHDGNRAFVLQGTRGVTYKRNTMNNMSGAVLIGDTGVGATNHFVMDTRLIGNTFNTTGTGSESYGVVLFSAANTEISDNDFIDVGLANHTLGYAIYYLTGRTEEDKVYNNRFSSSTSPPIITYAIKADAGHTFSPTTNNVAFNNRLLNSIVGNDLVSGEFELNASVLRFGPQNATTPAIVPSGTTTIIESGDKTVRLPLAASIGTFTNLVANSSAATPAIQINTGSVTNEFLFRSGSANFGWDWIEDEAVTGNLTISARNSGVNSATLSLKRSDGSVAIGGTHLSIGGAGYTWPGAVGGANTFLTDVAGNGTLSWAAIGGTISGLTAGTIPIATSPTALGNSHWLGSATYFTPDGDGTIQAGSTTNRIGGLFIRPLNASSNTVSLYDSSGTIASVFGPAGGLTLGGQVPPGAGNLTLNLNTSKLSFGANADTILTWGAANTLEQRNGVNAQTLWIDNTFTDASNYERIGLYWTGNVALLQTLNAGTGAARGLNIRSASTLTLGANGADKWQVQTTELNPSSDAGSQIGDAVKRVNGVTSTIYTANAGSISSDTPNVFSQQLNSGGTTFHVAKIVATNTASAAASELLQFLGGAAGTTEVAAVRLDGQVQGTSGLFTGVVTANNGFAGNSAVITGGSVFVLTSGGLSLGNGSAPGNFNIWEGGKTTAYNSITTVSGGIPAEYATVDLTAQTAAITTTALYTPTATGMFRISFVIRVTTAASVSSILGGTTGIVLTFTEPDGSVAQTFVLATDDQTGAVVIPANGNTANTTQAMNQGTAVIYAKTGVAIQYAVGYSSTGTPMQYSVHAKCEAL